MGVRAKKTYLPLASGSADESPPLAARQSPHRWLHCRGRRSIPCALPTGRHMHSCLELEAKE
eukprot:scaffold41482_cov20-Prasinocladus_malaysianus.AAC.1